MVSAETKFAMQAKTDAPRDNGQTFASLMLTNPQVKKTCDYCGYNISTSNKQLFLRLMNKKHVTFLREELFNKVSGNWEVLNSTAKKF